MKKHSPRVKCTSWIYNLNNTISFPTIFATLARGANCYLVLNVMLEQEMIFLQENTFHKAEMKVAE